MREAPCAPLRYRYLDPSLDFEDDGSEGTPTSHESLGIQATVRRCCFGGNRIIMVVAVDRAKLPLTGNRQSHVEAGPTAPAGQRPT